ncbi:DUF5327 family protein [Aquibacillus saliphilus]|uniref:DUF5327 family protein n=1 Tax=Aquibacillus saliphilus TaxID=1909422 RepID=UPI001CF0856B|nr:DUF5327 family protein [Aquibacillus saliphilus]
MAISSQAVLSKMIKELQVATTVKDQEAVREHVHAVRLLCDLLLDDPETVEIDQEQEMKKMIGATDQQPIKDKKSTPSLDHDEGNGKSIFDF